MKRFQIMNSILMNTFRACFCAICIVTVTFMVGYWFYKFQIEDRDIGVVDYQSFEQAKEVDFPIPYLCFLDPFVKNKNDDIDTNINATTYIEYLKGEIFDISFQNISYPNVTLNLSNYFLSASQKSLNESEFKTSNLSFNHKEIFSGFFYNGYFSKCFSFENELKQNHHIHEIILRYNKTKLFDDLGASEESELDIYYGIYYPDQFLLQLGSPWKLSKSIYDLYLVLWIDEIELLKRRSSWKKQCTKTEKPFDELVLLKHVETVGCRPPYFDVPTSFPICNTQEKIKEGVYDFKDVRNRYYPTACTRISKLSFNPKPGIHSKDEDINYWDFRIVYPEEVRLITQSKEVDVHTLIGSIGGYIGLFLGNLVCYHKYDMPSSRIYTPRYYLS